jgi:neutral amino acid transport system substrate-binding protein
MPGYLRTGRRLAAVAIGATAALALAACSSNPGGGAASSSASASSSSSSASAAAAVATCGSGTDTSKTFALGTFLPLTGSLASLGPAAVSGGGLALSDIKAAGGVNGTDPCVISTDSSDTTNTTLGLTNVKKLIAAKVSAILGAESSSVSESVLPTVDASHTVMFSPANTDDKLTGISKWYFRDAPPNSVEGNALGQQIVNDGHSKVGLLVFNDSYGTNLRDSIEKSVSGAGGTVVYGASGKNQEFPVTETSFTSEVSAILATKPDAIVVDAFDQTAQILPALASAGWPMTKVYLVDGNLNDFTSTKGVPVLTGAKGSTQGINATPAFKAQLKAWYKKNENAELNYFGYSAESYDAVVIMALAADEAKSSAPASIQAKILPVTGSTNGTVCKSYAECLKLIKGGNTNVHYEGYSGIGALNTGHDPSSGYISIYQYVGKAPSKFLSSVKG